MGDSEKMEDAQRAFNYRARCHEILRAMGRAIDKVLRDATTGDPELDLVGVGAWHSETMAAFEKICDAIPTAPSEGPVPDSDPLGGED